MKTVFGYTWIGWTNILLVQWLGIRLCYVADIADGELLTLCILYWVVPGTGWFTRYWPTTHKTKTLWRKSI
jgi:hypothetical protein